MKIILSASKYDEIIKGDIFVVGCIKSKALLITTWSKVKHFGGPLFQSAQGCQSSLVQKIDLPGYFPWL